MKNLVLKAIRFYRKKISPKKKSCCRFRPTCSGYALQAVEKHGAFLGLLMAISRIIRCNPYSRGGYDPVPQKKIPKYVRDGNKMMQKDGSASSDSDENTRNDG